MTAINPARLKIQCAELSQSYSEPDKFTVGLHDLLSFYSSRIRHTGIRRIPLTLETYQVPTPVLRAVEKEMDELINTQPSLGLLLVDALWEEEWLEFRQLAVILLGNIPPINPDSIVKRIRLWLSVSTTEAIRSLVFTKGIHRLVIEKPDLVLMFFKDTLANPTKNNCQAVLFGLVLFVDNPEFGNLPVIFSLLGDILLVEEKGLIKESLLLLRKLLLRSEQETLYFLIKQLSTASKPRITRIVRSILPDFSNDNQALLRDKLQDFSQP